MKKILALFVCSAAVLLAASCAQEEFRDYEPGQDDVKVTFTAVLADEDAATKAVLGTSANGKPQSMWEDGDEITIHNGTKDYTFVTRLEGPAPKAEFTYSKDDFTAEDGVIAVYPAGSYTADLESLTVSAAVPTEQTAIAGSYDPSAAVSVAYTKTESLAFKNAVAMLKFTLADADIHSVVFSGNNSEPVAGSISIAMKEDGTIAAVTPKQDEDAVSSVTLTPGDGAFEAGKTYYIAVAPQTLSKGFNISFRLIEGGPLNVVKSYPNSIDLAKNKIYNLGELSFDMYAGLGTGEPYLKSMKFTVADNPGKILSRKFSHSFSGTFTKSYKLTKSDVTEEACTVSDGKVSLNLPYLNNRKLVPVFEVSEGSALVYEGGIIKSSETEVDFAKYKQIRVVNGDKKEKVYTIDFTNTGLPVVVINQVSGTVTTESEQKYKAGSEAWYKATGTAWQPKDSDWAMAEDGKDNFMVYNPDGTSALTDKKGNPVDGPVMSSTRLRGNVTQEMPKKPFAVKLDSKSGVLDMLPHKRWVLLANWKDRTLMRNAVAFGIADVFKQTFKDAVNPDGTSAAGMGWNPSGQFVELVYNGVHVGTYYLCEHIKIDGNRLDINDPYDKDDAYSGIPEDYGYLLESDDAYDETWGFTTKCYVPFLFKDDGNQAMLDYAAALVRGIEDNLYAGNYDQAFANMDLASFVDFWLVQELMMNSETKHPKSCYSYINEGIMYAGPVWDFDWNTLPASTSYSEEGYSYTKSMLTKADADYYSKNGYPSEPNNEGDANYIWYPLLVKSDAFTTLAASRWNAVKGALSTYVSTEIPKIKEEIAVSEALNYSMWPMDEKGRLSFVTDRYSVFGIGGGFCGDEGMSFSESVEQLRATLNTRISGMDTYINNKNWK
ncbi:MAG: CotH kinase family protein [Bacteroidales bacterium]|nr:CotH kinase family protein [Bacteroidales bacterium]